MKGDFLSKLLNYYGLNQEGYRVLTREPSFSSIPPLEDEANLGCDGDRGRDLYS